MGGQKYGWGGSEHHEGVQGCAWGVAGHLRDPGTRGEVMWGTRDMRGSQGNHVGVQGHAWRRGQSRRCPIWGCWSPLRGTGRPGGTLEV